MWDATRFQETLKSELTAAHDGAEIERLVHRHATQLLRTLAAERHRPASPDDEPAWGELLETVDILRSHAHTLTRNDPERFWALWSVLLVLYATVAQRLSNHTRYRTHLAVAFARMGWLLQQAFDWFWQRAHAIPEALWNALYRLYTAASERRVVWKRVEDPITRDGKTSPHEQVAAVLATFLVDPARTPPPQLAAFRELIETHAAYLQIVPKSWLAPDDKTHRYGFSLHSWAPPRLPGDATEQDLWLLDCEAMLHQLQQQEEGAAAHTEPDRIEAQNVRETLYRLLAQPPKVRSQRRESGALEPARLIQGWDAIYTAVAGRPFEYQQPGSERSPYLRTQRIALFVDGLGNVSDANDEEHNLLRVWDKSAEGWQLIQPLSVARITADTFVPQQLVALQTTSPSLDAKRWVLARIRWRSQTENAFHIGIQRFTYDRVIPLAARPLSPIGTDPLPWSPAFLLIRSRDALDPWETLIVPVQDEPFPQQWELHLNKEERLILVEERLEVGYDYCWFSFRSL